MRKLLSHSHKAPRPAAFFAPAPGTEQFNNIIEEHHPGISHPQAAPHPVAFSAPSPATALFNNITEKYRSPLYLRLMGGESHA